MKKLAKIMTRLWLLCVIIALVLFGIPRLFQIGLYNVTSGSMSPTYKVGDLVYAFPTKSQEIKVGDTISFVLNNQGTVATHRVIEIDEHNQEFKTQGDANEVADGTPVKAENIIGVVRFSVPCVGAILQALSTGMGRIILVGVFLIYLLGLLLSGHKQKPTGKGGKYGETKLEDLDEV